MEIIFCLMIVIRVGFNFTIVLLDIATYINWVWSRWFQSCIVNRILINLDYFMTIEDLHHTYHTYTYFIRCLTQAQQCVNMDNHLVVNTFRSAQTGYHSTDNTFKSIHNKNNLVFQWVFHYILFPGVQLTINWHWFLQCFVARHLNKPFHKTTSIKTPDAICVTRPQKLNIALVWFG